MLRTIIIAAVVVLLAVAGYAFWDRGTDESAGYVTQSIDRGTIASTVTATGTVNPVTSVQVGTYVSGPIKAIYVDYNSPVKAGQLVAKIDPAPFTVKVKQAEANVANARAKVDKDRADLNLKKVTLGRDRKLLAQQLISEDEFDTAKSNYEQAVAQLALDTAGIQQNEAALEEAQINLAYTDIKSPVDGVVVSRNVDVGQTVAASFQTPTLFLIAQDLTKMQVDTSVSESDIGDISAGQPASFTVDAYPGKAFHGTIAQVRNAPTVVQNVVTYDVVISVDNKNLDLKPGMTATVTITTAERDDVLRVPLRALRFNPHAGKAVSGGQAKTARDRTGAGTQTVWVMQPDGTVRGVQVQLGVRNDENAEVVSGDLHAGDQVAIAFKQGSHATTGSSGPAAPRFHVHG